MNKSHKKKSDFVGNAHHLIIDFGNTLAKIAIFRGDNEIEIITKNALFIKDIASISKKYSPSHCIISSVVKIPEGIYNYLQSNFIFIELSHQTPVPVNSFYRSPETLGHDRLSVANAAAVLFSGQNVLVIDAGTCVTYDLIDAAGNYHGGGISPGIKMRFKALHTFTERLPLVNHKNFEGLAGTTTEESILSGVLNGIIAEIDGIIDQYQKKYPDLKVVVTGGDVNFLAKKLKSNIFAIPNFVLKGLNVILNFNVKQQQEPI